MTDEVLNAIPFGEANAISRDALAAKLGLSDRLMRKAVEDARREGHIIVHYSAPNSGYFRTEDISEIKRYYEQEHARAMSILVSIRGCKAVLDAQGVKV